MSKYQDLMSDMSEALVKGQKFRRLVLAVFVGDLQADEKRGKMIDDAYIIARLKKAVQVANENYKLTSDNKYLNEIEIFETYLPKQMTESEIKDALQAYVADMGGKEKVSMGLMMGYMKTEYQGQYDGKQASSIAKTILS